ncbi:MULTISPECIES: hypothetical protein [unclassified Nocardioides]|uniref:hypothetical protein n=1 Tax=unclassified Nocardioides TaxID=2615069 RepID=UPI000A9136FD|nr:MULTISPECIES: hypothetical protein [unclassified Nocardioides]
MEAGEQTPRSHQPTRQSEPDVRPLGFIAVGFAVLSALLALSVLWSPLAYLPAAVAAFLGFVARRDRATRLMGNVTLIVAGAAIVWATCMLFVVFDDSFGY